MRSRILPIAIVVVVLLAGCVAPLQTTTDTPEGTATDTPAATAEASDAGTSAGATPTSASSESPTISVSGSGEVSAEADLARVFVSVVATAETADEARAQVATDVERMRAALRNASVPDDAVTTTSFTIVPQYDYSGDRPNLTGYQTVHAFRIEVAPDRAGEIVDVVVGNGADQVDAVQFTLSDERRAELRTEALTRAMNAARVDAEAIAAAGDLEIAGIRSASTTGDVFPVAETRVAESAGGGAGTTLQPAPVVVSATVSVTYEAAANATST
jgi:hypothetical protein